MGVLPADGVYTVESTVVNEGNRINKKADITGLNSVQN